MFIDTTPVVQVDQNIITDDSQQTFFQDYQPTPEEIQADIDEQAAQAASEQAFADVWNEYVSPDLMTTAASWDASNWYEFFDTINTLVDEKISPPLE